MRKWTIVLLFFKKKCYSMSHHNLKLYYLYYCHYTSSRSICGEHSWLAHLQTNVKSKLLIAMYVMYMYTKAQILHRFPKKTWNAKTAHFTILVVL
jgi:hypothetical protein